MFLIMILAPEMALAQLGARAPASTSVATQLPLSGRSAEFGVGGDNANAHSGRDHERQYDQHHSSSQRAVCGQLAESNTPFSGKLSFNEAIQRGLEFNLGATGQATAVQQARGQAKVSRSNLLPNLTGAFSEHYLTTDLATTGIQSAISSSFGSSFGGRAPVLPTVVGPISYYDLRVTLTQNFLDLTLLNNYRSSRDVVRANEASMQDARDTVVLAVGASYLQVIAAKARVASERAQLETAEAVYQTDCRAARHGPGGAVGRESGSGARADRAAASGDDGERSWRGRKSIWRGSPALPPNDKYDISDDFDYSPAPALSADEAVQQALAARADLQAAEAQLKAAERTRAAARSERLPSLSVSADFGEIGTHFNQGRDTYTVTGTLNIPIWQGGRVGGDIAQADAALRQRRAGTGRHARADRERCSERISGSGSGGEPGRVVKEQSAGGAGEPAADAGEV